MIISYVNFANCRCCHSRDLLRDVPGCSDSCDAMSAVEFCADEPLKQTDLIEAQHCHLAACKLLCSDFNPGPKGANYSHPY